jgi:UDP-glucuronate decarboxylase
MMSDVSFGFFNIGSQNSISILELAKMMIKNSGLNLKPEFKDALEGDAKISLSDISLAKNKLKWNPTYKLEKWFEDEVFKK